MTAVFVITVLAFLVFTAWREREHREEIREMAQRIQAPERAVAAHSRREAAAPRRRSRPVPLDDDAAMSRVLGDVDVDS